MNLAERLIEATRLPKRIMVIGDGMTDVYVHGMLLDPSSCQEGCPKFVEDRRVVVPGGAGNAARSLHHWNVRVAFYGQPAGPTKTRFVAGDTGRYVMRYDDDRSIDTVRLPILRETAERFLPTADAVFLSDYNKGMLTPKFIRDVVETCRDLGIPCVADCKREPGLYAGCVLKCNHAYFMQHVMAMHQMEAQYVATDGPSDPCVSGTVHYRNGRLSFPPPSGLPPVPCVNHVGAGDCFGGHLTLALAHGFSLPDAATVAHSAGRVYVQSPHNAPPSPADVAADMVGSR